MQPNKREIYFTKYIRIGASFGFIIPPDIREFLHLIPGDHMAMQIANDLLWVRKITREHLFNRAEIDRVYDRIFQSREKPNDKS